MSGEIPKEVLNKAADNVDEAAAQKALLEAQNELFGKVADKAVIGDSLTVSAPQSLEAYSAQVSERFAELAKRLPEDVLKDFIANQQAGVDSMDADSRLAMRYNLELLKRAEA